MTFKPEETGLALASEKASPVRDAVLSADSPARAAEASGVVEETADNMTGEEALSLKEKLKGDEVSSTAGSDKGINGEKGSIKDKADKIAQLTRVITDEKVEGSKEVKEKTDNGDNAGIINKKTPAPVSTLDVKGSEKAETITQNVKEAARDGIKAERHLELSEGKADLSKVVSDKSNQDAETGAFKGKGKGEGDFSLSQETL
ncbi:MAG: hypothetical protein V3V95_00120 [Thermodesulfobacteriota bacterium]